MRLTIDKLTERLQSHKPQEVAAPGARTAAVAFVLTPVTQGFELFLMKRAERPGDPWSGQISLPGGHSEQQDANLAATARRETLEEMGLVVPVTSSGQLNDVYPRNPVLPDILVRPFVFVVESVQRLSLGPEAVLDIRASISELDQAYEFKTVRAHGRLLKVPGYRVGPHFVWGLTERVISGFLALL